MKVLHINDREVRGGAESFVWQLASTQAKTGEIEPYVATSEGNRGIRIFSMSRIGGEFGDRLWYGLWRMTRTSFDPLSYASTRRIIRNISPSILHFHNIKLLSPSVLKAAHAERLPIVFTLHDFYWLCPKLDLLLQGELCHDTTWEGCITNCRLGRFENLFKFMVSPRIKEDMLSRRNMIKKNNVIIVATTEVMHQALVERGYDPNMIVSIHMGVDTQLFSPTRASKERYVLYVGRLATEKGIQDFLTIAKMYKKRYKEKLEFRVIGGNVKNDDVNSIAWMTQKELVVHYAKALVFLSRGSRGLAPMEAMACGTPVIAYSFPSWGPEIIRNDYDGFLVKNGDVHSALRKIVYLADNPDLAEQMGYRARKKIEQSFSFRKTVDEYSSLYKKLVHT